MLNMPAYLASFTFFTQYILGKQSKAYTDKGSCCLVFNCYCAFLFSPDCLNGSLVSTGGPLPSTAAFISAKWLPVHSSCGTQGCEVFRCFFTKETVHSPTKARRPLTPTPKLSPGKPGSQLTSNCPICFYDFSCILWFVQNDQLTAEQRKQEALSAALKAGQAVVEDLKEVTTAVMAKDAAASSGAQRECELKYLAVAAHHLWFRRRQMQLLLRRAEYCVNEVKSEFYCNQMHFPALFVLGLSDICTPLLL
jgi:hypothetical protein